MFITYRRTGGMFALLTLAAVAFAAAVLTVAAAAAILIVALAVTAAAILAREIGGCCKPPDFDSSKPRAAKRTRRSPRIFRSALREPPISAAIRLEYYLWSTAASNSTSPRTNGSKLKPNGKRSRVEGREPELDDRPRQ